MTTSTTIELNLARKWRPKTFDTIVGQDIPVRMLKNGLYLKKFFPVYLFAGQRGCGKTSTARVFATAINCQQLSTFQENPATTLPCLSCESCKAMMRNHHPDFIEIDAASHTGVDHVRQLIDASSYMPLLGHKKIYLIDEAHMLSKAAFNAFLKILEEPPMSVLFMLATTETHKIPDTVLSRCFHVVFNPIEQQSLKDHILFLCQQESITIEDAALDILINETEGSARDAINLLERVRFSHSTITEQTILSLLGKISNTDLYELITTIVQKQPEQLMAKLSTIQTAAQSPTIIWNMIIDVCRSLMWIKYQCASKLAPWIQQQQTLFHIAQNISFEQIHTICQHLWNHEELFFKTTKKHAFLEIVLLQLATNTIPTISPKPQQPLSSPSPKLTQGAAQQHSSSTHTASPAPAQTPTSTHNTLPAWNDFIQNINKTGDALLASIFTQAKLIDIPQDHGAVHVQLHTKSKFFTDKIAECKTCWHPLFRQAFPHATELVFVEPHNTPQQTPPPRPVAQPSSPPPAPPRSAAPSSQSSPQPWAQRQSKTFARNTTTVPALDLAPISVEDKEKWPQANLLLSHFPGKIKKLEKESSLTSSSTTQTADQEAHPA